MDDDEITKEIYEYNEIINYTTIYTDISYFILKINTISSFLIETISGFLIETISGFLIKTISSFIPIPYKYEYITYAIYDLVTI